MKKLLIGALTLMAIIGLSGCANPNEITKEEMKTVKFLNNDELKQTFTGKTIAGTSYKSRSGFQLSYTEDGMYSGTVGNGKKAVSGKWFLKDENLSCIILMGKELCRKVYTDGKKYYSVDENMVKTSEYTFK